MGAVVPRAVRSRAIILREGPGGAEVALIERRRGGRLYYVFPGGGGEPGESPAEAVVREVAEELGLRVAPGRLVAEVAAGDAVQYFFVVSVAGGRFGTGHGPELRGETPGERGAYTPRWVPVAGLHRLDGPVYPEAVAVLVAEAPTGGWPREVIRVSVT